MKTACIPINLQRCESPVWIVSTSYIFLLCSMITCTICPIVDYEPKAPCCVRNSPSPARNRHAVENSESTAGGSALAIKILWTDPCITDIYIYNIYVANSLCSSIVCFCLYVFCVHLGSHCFSQSGRRYNQPSAPKGQHHHLQEILSPPRPSSGYHVEVDKPYSFVKEHGLPTNHLPLPCERLQKCTWTPH